MQRVVFTIEPSSKDIKATKENYNKINNTIFETGNELFTICGDNYIENVINCSQSFCLLPHQFYTKFIRFQDGNLKFFLFLDIEDSMRLNFKFADLFQCNVFFYSTMFHDLISQKFNGLDWQRELMKLLERSGFANIHYYNSGIDIINEEDLFND